MLRQVRQLSLPAVAALGLWGCASTTPAVRGDAPRAHWETDAYEVTLRPEGEAALGAPARLSVEVRTRGGYHLNDDYPIHFTPAPGSDVVSYRKARFDRLDGIVTTPCGGGEAHHACAATVPVPYALRRSPATVGGELAFSACDADHCLIEKIDVATLVTASR